MTKTGWTGVARLLPLLGMASALSCGGAAVKKTGDAPPEHDRRTTFYVPRYTMMLENGIRLFVVPDWTSHLVEIGVRYEAGAKDEPPEREGLAHLAEHISFLQRADADGRSLWDALDEASLASNAYTTLDSTHFVTLAREDRLEEIIALEAKRMKLGCAGVTPEDFEGSGDGLRFSGFRGAPVAAAASRIHRERCRPAVEPELR